MIKINKYEIEKMIKNNKNYYKITTKDKNIELFISIFKLSEQLFDFLYSNK